MRGGAIGVNCTAISAGILPHMPSANYSHVQPIGRAGDVSGFNGPGNYRKNVALATKKTRPYLRFLNRWPPRFECNCRRRGPLFRGKFQYSSTQGVIVLHYFHFDELLGLRRAPLSLAARPACPTRKTGDSGKVQTPSIYDEYRQGQPCIAGCLQ